MSTTSAFRACLDAGDAVELRRLWAVLSPHLHQPTDDREVAVVLHRARTGAASVALHRRLYSHAWLTERGIPSGLPDELRPPAERGGARVMSAVGVSVRARAPERKELAAAIEAAMAAAAAEAFDSGITDPTFVSARMWEARDRVLRRS